MTDFIVSLTKLDIINSMLAATGTSPVTASDTTHPAYVKAEVKLADVATSVQKLKLWFNTAPRTLTANADGEIVLPAGTLNVDPDSRHKHYVKRGIRLYDMDNDTYNLGVGTTVCVRICQYLDLPDIPETALQYTKSKARYEFYLDEDGTEPKLSKYKELMQFAWVELYKEHLNNQDTNYFDGPNTALFLKRGSGSIRNRLAPYE